MRSPFDTFGIPGPFRRRRGGQSLAARVAAIMAARDGFWAGGFDPVAGRLFQTSTADPATAAGQSVGFVQDAAGASPADFASVSSWTNGDWDTFSTTAAAFSASKDVSGGNDRAYSNTFVAATSGLFYEIEVDVTSGTVSSFGYRLSLLTDGRSTSVVVALVSGTSRGVVQAMFSGTWSVLVSTTAIGALSISGARARQLPGNHAIQATFTSRPTLRQSGGVWYLEDDGGDSLNATLPAGTYTRVTVDTSGTVTTTANISGGSVDVLAVNNLVDVLFATDLTGDDLATVQAYMASLV